jgi:polyhydroxyalkanoate synthesis regulator protein
MSVEIVDALGPGSHLSELARFTASYKVATAKFSELLQYPFLQSIILSEGEKGSDDLRTIVADGSSRFNQLCTTNVSVAQQVNSYGKTVPVLLKNVTIAKYATSMQPVVARYIAEATASSNDNEQFFESVSTALLR